MSRRHRNHITMPVHTISRQHNYSIKRDGVSLIVCLVDGNRQQRMRSRIETNHIIDTAGVSMNQTATLKQYPRETNAYTLYLIDCIRKQKLSPRIKTNRIINQARDSVDQTILLRPIEQHNRIIDSVECRFRTPSPTISQNPRKPKQRNEWVGTYLIKPLR